MMNGTFDASRHRWRERGSENGGLVLFGVRAQT
jgi:hypothetical protein